MSVLDTESKREKHTDSLAFLDPNGGVTIQRYEAMRYPQFDRLTDSQLGFFWRPQEVDILRDAADFKALAAHEKHIFISNLQRQIVLDSVQGRSPSLAFLPIVSLPEIEAWVQAWGFSEMIHSRSYTHIIRNVFPDSSVVFDQIMKIKPIVDCAKDISSHYDELIRLSQWHALIGEGTHTVNGQTVKVDLREIKRALWMALMSVNILEGIRFYVSFACSWAFAETKRMEGNAKIIKLICLSDDTEILTPNGFKLFKDLDRDADKVAQYNPDGSIDFVRPMHHIEQDAEPNQRMIRFTNPSGLFDMLVTPEHRVIYRDVGSDGVREALAEHFNPSPAKEFPAAGLLRGKADAPIELTWMERFRVAVQADGHIEERMTGAISGFRSVVFTLYKRRKIERLMAIAEALDLRHTLNLRDEETGETVVRVRYPANWTLDKTLEWVDLTKVGHEWCRDFLNEIAQWDGHERTSDSFVYCSTDAHCIDKAQQIAVLAGWRSHWMTSEDHRKESYKDYHRLSVHRHKSAYNCGPKPVTKSVVEDYTGKVYCVTVPSGMIVVRRKGRPFVTGNCRDENLHLASTQALLRMLPKEDPEFEQIAAEQREQVIDLFKAAVDQEREWASYLFQGGSMIGLNAALLSDYVEWIGNKRLGSVGLPHIWKTGSNPLPWTQKWIAGQDVQVAPQQTQISSYQIGAVKKDVTPDTFKGFKL